MFKKVDILVVNEVEAEFYCHEKIDSVEKAKTEIKKMAENTIIMLFSHLEKMEQWLTKWNNRIYSGNESRCD